LSVDFRSLHNVFKHPIRQRIIVVLLERKELTYVDLMNIVEVANTGKLNYHLKILGDLIEKDKNGKYRLTEKGQLASQFLMKFPEKAVERSQFSFADAVLIGFVGLVLTTTNPGFWGFPLIGVFGIGLFPVLAILILAYALIVPGGVMWRLTVRRARSHDPYDLFKPPFITSTLIVLSLIAMLLLKISVTVTFTTSMTDSSYSRGEANLSTLLLSGLIFSFLGVGVSELIQKVVQKRKS
jgi:hypothetical protein